MSIGKILLQKIERDLGGENEEDDVQEGETIRIEFVESVHIISFVYSKQTKINLQTHIHT